jgi:hypothetical protein
MFAFERAGGDAGAAYALVVLNTNARAPKATGPMAVGAAPGTVLVDVLGPEQQEVTVDPTGAVQVSVAPQRAMILIPRDQVAR